MKILYAFQGTGNGHASRAMELMPYLKRFGEVDTLISGTNYNLKFPFDINYSFTGLSLFYGAVGNLDYYKIWKNNSILKLIRNAFQLPLDQYDLIINDFEPITSLACKVQNKNSVHFGHQASFNSKLVPRPEKIDSLGEYILKYYCSGTGNIGLHFKPYDNHIFSPIIKKTIQQADSNDRGHILFYLPGYNLDYLEKLFRSMPDCEFHCFLPGIHSIMKQENRTYFPMDKQSFDTSLIHCKGIVTGAGFETPSEALYLNKKLLIKPIKNHYEQECNAVALEKMGIKRVISDELNEFKGQIYNWLDSTNAVIPIQANDINSTLDYLFSMHNSFDYEIENQEDMETIQGLLDFQ